MEARTHWIVSKRWDSFWVFCGLWLGAIGAVIVALGGFPAFSPLILLFAPLARHLHTLAPVGTFFSSPIYDGYKASNWRGVYGGPLLVVVLTFLLCYGALLLLKTGIARGALVFIAIAFFYLMGEVYHFVGQNIGVFSLYRKKADQASSRDRVIDRAYCFVFGYCLVPLYWYVTMIRLGNVFQVFPNYVGNRILVSIIVFLSVILSVAYSIYEWQKPNAAFPKILYAISLAIQPLSGLAFGPLFFVITYHLPHFFFEIGLQLRANIDSKVITRRRKLFSILPTLILASLVLILIDQKPIMALWESRGTIDFTPLYFENSGWIATSLLATVLSFRFLHIYFNGFLYNPRNPFASEFIRRHFLRIG